MLHYAIPCDELDQERYVALRKFHVTDLIKKAYKTLKF